MIADEAQTARLPELAAEEAAWLEESRAPTLRDLHGTVNDLLALLAPGASSAEQDRPTK